MDPNPSTKYAVLFALMAAMAVVAGVTAEAPWWWQAVLYWAAGALAVVAAAYALRRPGLLMKRPDGSRPLWFTLLLLPYFALTELSLAIYRLSNHRSPAIAEVAPGLWFARRPTGREARVPGVKWSGVLDLAAEFTKSPVRCQHYRSLPLLDATTPTDEQLRSAIDWLDDRLKDGPVLVHCALGHGRTGCVVLGWLLRHGHVPDVAAGVARLRKLRPGFGVSASQTAAIKAWMSSHI